MVTPAVVGCFRVKSHTYSKEEGGGGMGLLPAYSDVKYTKHARHTLVMHVRGVPKFIQLHRGCPTLAPCERSSSPTTEPGIYPSR